MKYLDVSRGNGGLNGFKISEEIIEKFFPDISAAMEKRGIVLRDIDAIMLAQNLTGLIVHAAIACCNKHKRAPDKVRLILKISRDYKAFVFFVPLSSDNKMEVPAKECPMSVIGADAKDFEELKKKYPNVNLSLGGGKMIGNN